MTKLSTLVNAFTADEADNQLRQQLNSKNLVDFIAARLPTEAHPLEEVAAHHFKNPFFIVYSAIYLTQPQVINTSKERRFPFEAEGRVSI